jgi:peptide/nickel transport system permease protein
VTTTSSADNPSGPSTPDLERADVSRSQVKEFWRRFRRNRAAMIGLAFLLLMIAVALAAPLIAQHGPNDQNVSQRLLGVSGEHWLGTDDLGRDTFSRLIHGARISLYAGAFATLIGVVLGAPAGIVAGFRGGWVDLVLSRIADTLLSLPAIILAITAIAVLGPGVRNAMIAIGIVLAPRFFRVLRGAAQSVGRQTFIEASRGIGCSTPRILRCHVLPNVASPLIVQISLAIGMATLAEAALSFIGLGVQPPDPSWGAMIGRGYRFIYDAPLMIFVPGLAIMLTVLAYNMIGDGIRDSMGREVRRG